VIACLNMKQYIIDELRLEDHAKIKAFFDEHFDKSGMGEIYWVPLDKGLFTDVQIKHVECHPFYFAVVLKPESVAFEMLVRTKNSIGCDCMAYATATQREWLIRFADSIFEQLEIII